MSSASVRPLTPFPASSTPYAACGFPALRTLIRFTPRVMKPIEPGALSAAADCDDSRGSAQTGPACRTATAYSTSSSRTPSASVPASSGASPSSPPNPEHTQSTGPNDRRRSRSVDTVPSSVATVKEVLADNGCATGGEVAQVKQRGMEVPVATTAERRRQRDFRPPMLPRPQREV